MRRPPRAPGSSLGRRYTSTPIDFLVRPFLTLTLIPISKMLQASLAFSPPTPESAVSPGALTRPTGGRDHGPERRLLRLASVFFCGLCHPGACPRAARSTAACSWASETGSRCARSLSLPLHPLVGATQPASSASSSLVYPPSGRWTFQPVCFRRGATKKNPAENVLESMPVQTYAGGSARLTGVLSKAAAVGARPPATSASPRLPRPCSGAGPEHSATPADKSLQ